MPDEGALRLPHLVDRMVVPPKIESLGCAVGMPVVPYYVRRSLAGSETCGKWVACVLSFPLHFPPPVAETAGFDGERMFSRSAGRSNHLFSVTGLAMQVTGRPYLCRLRRAKDAAEEEASPIRKGIRDVVPFELPDRPAEPRTQPLARSRHLEVDRRPLLASHLLFPSRTAARFCPCLGRRRRCQRCRGNRYNLPQLSLLAQRVLR